MYQGGVAEYRLSSQINEELTGPYIIDCLSLYQAWEIGPKRDKGPYDIVCRSFHASPVKCVNTIIPIVNPKREDDGRTCSGFKKLEMSVGNQPSVCMFYNSFE